MSTCQTKDELETPKIRIFEHRPTADELACPIGYGEMGSSATMYSVDSELNSFGIVPQQIPVRFCAACVYIVVAIFLGFAIWRGETILYAMAALSGFVIAPVMVGLISWLNDTQGDQDYILVDKENDLVSLPRIPIKFPIGQVDEVVQVRFGDALAQVCLLVKDDDQWLYCHAYNGGEGGRPDKKFAAALGCKYSRYDYTERQVKEILGKRLFECPTNLPAKSLLAFKPRQQT